MREMRVSLFAHHVSRILTFVPQLIFVSFIEILVSE